MRWTRLSFAYLITYLGAGGLALLMAPSSALHLLGATGAYPAPLARFLGGFMVAFAILVAGIVRHRAEVLYPVTLLVRVELLAVMVWLYLDTRDPLFIVLSAVVGVGMGFTALGFLADRSHQKAGR